MPPQPPLTSLYIIKRRVLPAHLAQNSVTTEALSHHTWNGFRTTRLVPPKKAYSQGGGGAFRFRGVKGKRPLAKSMLPHHTHPAQYDVTSKLTPSPLLGSFSGTQRGPFIALGRYSSHLVIISTSDYLTLNFFTIKC